MIDYYDKRMNRRLNVLKKSSVKNFLLVERILNITKHLYEFSQWEEALHKYAKKSKHFYFTNIDTLLSNISNA